MVTFKKKEGAALHHAANIFSLIHEKIFMQKIID